MFKGEELMEQQEGTTQNNSQVDRPERTLSAVDILWLTIGALVGAGLITITGEAALATGYSVWLAFAVATILGFVSVIPYFFAAGTAVLDGGMYTTNALFGHPILGGLTALNSIPVVFGQASVAIGLGTYTQAVFPNINATLVAVLLVLVFYLFNIRGIDALAKVQGVMMYILLAGLFVFCIFASRNFNPEAVNFQGLDFFSNGIYGFIVAVNMLAFSTQSYYNALSYSKYTKKPKKNVLKGMLTSIPFIFLIYVGVTLFAVGAVNIDTYAGHTLSDVARQIMPPALFIIFTFAAPLMALATTLNGNMSSMSVNIATSAEDGWLPKSMAKRNKYNMPYVTVTFVTILILLPVIGQFSIAFITNNVMLFQNLMLLVPFYSIWRLPYKFPDLWKKSEAKIPMFWFHVIMVISLITRLILIAFSLISLSLVNLIINVSVAILIIIYAVLRYRSGKVSINPKYSEE